VLDPAARWAYVVPVDVIHRVIHDVTGEHGRRRSVPNVEYADLTRAMRTGKQLENVFDALTSAQDHADFAD